MTDRYKSNGGNIKSVYKIALENIDKRLAPTKIQLCAALMDPVWCNVVALAEELENRFRMTRVELVIKFVKKYKFNLVEEETSELAVAEPNQSQAQSSSQANGSSDYRKSLIAKFARPPTFVQKEAQDRRPLREEIQMYFEAAKSCTWDTQLLSWWSENESNFPVLAKLARFVLGIPATSAAAETAFSISSCVITAKRSKISPFAASQILFVHDNYDLVTNHLK